MKLRYVMYLDLIFCQREQISSSFRAQDSVSVLSIDNATQRRSANKKLFTLKELFSALITGVSDLQQ